MKVGWKIPVSTEIVIHTGGSRLSDDNRTGHVVGHRVNRAGSISYKVYFHDTGAQRWVSSRWVHKAEGESINFLQNQAKWAQATGYHKRLYKPEYADVPADYFVDEWAPAGDDWHLSHLKGTYRPSHYHNDWPERRDLESMREELIQKHGQEKLDRLLGPDAPSIDELIAKRQQGRLDWLEKGRVLQEGSSEEVGETFEDMRSFLQHQKDMKPY